MRELPGPISQGLLVLTAGLAQLPPSGLLRAQTRQSVIVLGQDKNKTAP